MKKQFILTALLFSAVVYSQVGINTETPKATLDVVGKPNITTNLDGIIAPRITGDQLRAKYYTTDQTGALVYVSAADSAPQGQTENVTVEGYYYFNGTKWVITGGGGGGANIYNANGSLTNNRNLTLNNKTLNFIGTDQSTSWDPTGVLVQSNLLPSSGESSMGFYGGNNSNLHIQQFYNGDAQILSSANSTSLIIGTHSTNASAPIRFSTSSGAGAAGQTRMTVTGEGNVGINTINPNASADLELGSNNKALLLNRVTNTAAVANPVNGMLIYDLEAKCAKIYQGDPLAWSGCLNGGSGSGGPGSGTISAFTCGSAGFAPSTATQGTAYSGFLEIPYIGGNGGTYAAQSFTTNGLTFTLAAGNFATGNGILKYSVSGTPITSGTTYVEISLAGKSCGGANAIALSVNGLTPGNPSGPSSGATGGAFGGRACFDVVEINEGGECGTLASRASQKADFSQTATNTQPYTFTPTGTVSNVRFVFVNTNGTVINSISGGNSGNNITGAVTATVKFNPNLNALAAGKSSSQALTADIYVIYNASANNTGTDVQLKMSVNVKDCVCCGAFIAPGVWKQFMCHNLGADTSLDPHTPVAGIHGAKYQWGRPTPPLTQAQDQASSAVVPGWSATPPPEFSWRDDTKTVNDPCPTGFRVPTLAQFAGLIGNNDVARTGTWVASPTNYGTALHFGPTTSIYTLTFPAAGVRESGNGSLVTRGAANYYVSSTYSTNPTGGGAGTFFFNANMILTQNNNATGGYPLRCIAQ